MSGNPLKSLYYASSLEELKNKSNINIPSKLPSTKCREKMSTLTARAHKARQDKDQELEFLYLHRYFLLLSHAVNDPNVSKKDERWKNEFQTAQCNEKKYNRLMEKLKARYQDLLEESKSFTSCITVYPADDGSKNKGYSNDKIGLKNHNVTEKNQKHSGDIDCFDLYKLITANPSKQTFLIMDVRPPGDFEESHINHQNVLNVSCDKIDLGMSANMLGKKFVDNDSLNLWKLRGNVDKLVLHDWNSTLSTLKIEAALNHLQEILLKWDQGVSYKSYPLILDGGYEELLATYPHITTNAKVTPPAKDFISQNSTVTTFDYPMEELEFEKENIPKNETRTKLIVDRSSKPQRQNVEKNNDSVKDVSKSINENMDSDASVISGSDLESTQAPVNSLNLTDNIVKSTPSSIIEERETKKMKKVKKPSTEPGVQPQNVETTQINSRRSESPDVNAKLSNHLSPHGSPTASKRDSPQRQLPELRKLKPQLGRKSQGSHMDSLKNRDEYSDSEDGIFTSPLKKDGGNGGLKRASSSPNIAQMKDDDCFHTRQPTFSRSNKPRSIQQPAYGERTDSTYGTTSAGLSGLKNFANNCYMNSILQCLNNTEPLVKEMTALPLNTLNLNSRSKGRVAQEVIRAFGHMWAGGIKIYSIKELKNVMGDIKDIFKGTAHQDSNEFLIILLEHLHEDLNKPAEVTVLDGADVDSGEKAWGEFRRKNCSIIQRLFYGQHKSTVTCSTCHHTSATFEQFFNLFVPIPSNQSDVTLNDCIQLYMSGERISGWKCPKCKTERNATKKFDISRLPPILVIALKRFTQEDDSWLQKKENIVHYPLEDLDMSRFTVANSEQRYSKYNLYAMSIHSGTLKSGHYRAICKNYKNQKWYLFDDQIVEPLQVQNVKNNPEVYILFYNAVTS